MCVIIFFILMGILHQTHFFERKALYLHLKGSMLKIQSKSKHKEKIYEKTNQHNLVCYPYPTAL